MKFRVWYKFQGKLDSCVVSASNKSEAKQTLKDAFPSANIGIIVKMEEEKSKRKKRNMEINTDGLL